MKIEQLYTNCLAEAAYYIESNGEVAIVDPLREYEPYVKKAEASGAKIKYVFETHFHADFVSGHIDLAKQTGATIVYGPNAETSFNAHVAKDGETFKVGDVTITVLHTPGHTLESSTFLLTDANGKKTCIFTGDTLFIGDVGRPDLAIKSDLTQEDLAGMLYDSLHAKILTLPDDIIVYPGHGAGSSCGKNLSSETWSTLGEQKKTNYALKAQTRAAFITELTTGILPPPQYFAKNAAMNKTGYDAIDVVVDRGSKALTVEQFETEVKNGALILDVRTKEQFVTGFVPGSIFIGLEGTFAMWVGALIKDINQKIVLVCPEGKEQEAVLRLARVGYDNTIGYLNGGIQAWVNAGKQLDTVAQVTADKLAETNLENIVDVRKPGEFGAGHIEDAISYPLDYINDHLNDLHTGTQYYLHCKSGYRSVIAISILKKQGYKQLVDIIGGYSAIEKANIPLVDVCTKSNA